MKRSAALALMLLAPQAFGDVTHDASTSEAGVAGNSITFSHTVAADADYLVVCGGNTFGSIFSLSGATYSGENLVLLSSAVAGGDTAYMWALETPDTGTHDVVLTWDGTGGAVYGYAASFKGVDSAAVAFNATGSSSELSQSADTTADGMVMDCSWVTASGTPGTEGEGQTEITNDGLFPSVSSYKSASGSSTSMEWTLDASVSWAHFGVAMDPAAGAGGEDDGFPGSLGCPSVFESPGNSTVFSGCDP